MPFCLSTTSIFIKCSVKVKGQSRQKCVFIVRRIFFCSDVCFFNIIFYPSFLLFVQLKCCSLLIRTGQCCSAHTFSMVSIFFRGCYLQSDPERVVPDPAGHTQLAPRHEGIVHRVLGGHGTQSVPGARTLRQRQPTQMPPQTHVREAENSGKRGGDDEPPGGRGAAGGAAGPVQLLPQHVQLCPGGRRLRRTRPNSAAEEERYVDAPFSTKPMRRQRIMSRCLHRCSGHRSGSGRSSAAAADGAGCGGRGHKVSPPTAKQPHMLMLLEG